MDELGVAELEVWAKLLVVTLLYPKIDKMYPSSTSVMQLTEVVHGFRKVNVDVAVECWFTLKYNSNAINETHIYNVRVRKSTRLMKKKTPKFIPHVQTRPTHSGSEN